MQTDRDGDVLARIDPADVREYERFGRWGTTALAAVISSHAHRIPDAPALISETERWSWSDYDRTSRAWAGALVSSGIEPRARVGVLLADGPAVHSAYVAAEKAGVVVVGIGPRAGDREIAHLLEHAGARTLVTAAQHHGRDCAELVAELRARGVALDRHIVLPEHGGPDDPVLVDGDAVTPMPPDALRAAIVGRRFGPNDLFLLNSTSGTTGLPKQVIQIQNRWMYFHQLATVAGAFTPADVFMSVLPAPFGFALWTTHFTPALLGSPVVVMRRFDAAGALACLERERVTVLSCVSTQFIMLLNEPELERYDLSSLRCIFTGGEAVPYRRAAEFEDRTSARVLQFYGSNETGAISCTTMADTRERRLGSAGRVIDEMRVRLLDDDGNDVAPGTPGQPACRGAATTPGYYDDDAANAQLFTADGWMLAGDIAVCDGDGYLTIVGRKSDFIIRGGKNISAAMVEVEVVSHPAVALAAAVPEPDDVFGERVCVYVELRPEASLELEELSAHLLARGVSKELLPERLIVVDEIERASGGKVAKGALKEDLRRRLSPES